MTFAGKVALRFFREGRTQSALIIGGASVGVAVMIFLSGIIRGVQNNIVRKTVDVQPHVTVRLPDEEARPLLGGIEAGVLDRVQKVPQRVRAIPNGPLVLETVARDPGVTACSPTLSGAGFAVRGTTVKSVLVRGIDGESYGRVVPLAPRVTAGKSSPGAGEVLVGLDLARDLGAGLGDKVRISGASGAELLFDVRGLLDFGNRELNLKWAFVSLTSAQTLLDLEGGFTAIEVRASDVFEADAVAARIQAATGLKAESWMALNRELMTALRSQSSSNALIQFFVVVAVALGIASVLYVSVVQKSREIGILKAMGAQTDRLLRVFLLQGLFVGIAGSLAGCALGAGLLVFFRGVARNPDGSPLFPIELDADIFVRSAAVALVAALLAAFAPARRAARLDPAQVIRYG
ncbi:MAG: FtsX-like permease family protein [Planctomycetes bacterium]|jgi:lipoprotein-releasing system permease protein|nr:FtsX-like permease family protein [Planctomycetota bacterium]